ncbi:MAG: thioredoxin family protein [Flammeovirgaceae bacterium]|nr:thioredoxin family protein [Flammeovirgaceae bacterium]
MNRVFIVFVWILSFQSLNAQILQPAKWSASASASNVKLGDELEIIFNVKIDPTWYLYSTEFPCEDGPLKTEFIFKEDPSYQLVGKVVPINPVDKYDEIFECDVKVFKKTAEFRQRIKVLSKDLTIAGEYNYQVCTEVDGKCIPGDGEFLVNNVEVTGKAPAQIKEQRAEKEKGTGYQLPVTGNDSIKEEKLESSGTTYEEIKGPQLDEALLKESPEQKSLWAFLLVSFLAGLAALLTPCVFPMIPMTVTFFTGQGRSKFQALIYGFFIILIYSIAGAAVAPLMGPETANHLSTEWLPNIIFFLVFVIFGLSFLGLFEITLPGTFITKVDRQAEKGGLTGVFFMAFTIVLVSFSCTGPIVGSILVSSAGGEILKPVLGMFAFSLAFAIPFTLFAFFPGWMKSLPKSGGWLNAVKVVLGFLELALAFKFLSIADQAFHWGILDREINIAIWIVISLLIGLYLMKAFRMPGDTGKDAEDKTISVPRVVMAIGMFTFVLYLVPGMWGAPLKALAGYLPPLYTHDFDLISTSKGNAGNQICDVPKYSDFLHLPHGLNGYFDYKQALACARQQNKPLFIDFTGHGCTNCREMEAVVWSDPLVLERLKNDYVVVALYVDDKTQLPEADWYTSSYDNKVKKTIGKQNADLQITNLKNNAQPFYVLLGADEKVLVSPYGYNKSVDGFVKFLDEGKKKYKELYR